MKYMGSKASIWKFIEPIILNGRGDDQYYIEPFAGGCNSIQNVDNPRIANDANSRLMTFFEQAVYAGFEPPIDISRDLYNWARDKNRDIYLSLSDERLVGYIGICGSYGGRWFDGGYAGITTTKEGKTRNYPLEAYNNVVKQIPLLDGCEFNGGCYKDLYLPPRSIVYCDPPYEGTKEYKQAKETGFSKDDFCDWVRQKVAEGHRVFCSEYEMPDDFICVWEKGVSSSLRANGVISGSKKSVERLFVHKSQI